MAISSVSINPPPSSSVTSVVSNAAAPFVNSANKSSADRQVSTIVNLSAQGQKLSQASNQTNQPQISQSQTSNRPDTVTSENVETKPKETAEAPGIQFMEGESKGGRVNTIA